MNGAGLCWVLWQPLVFLCGKAVALEELEQAEPLSAGLVRYQPVLWWDVAFSALYRWRRCATSNQCAREFRIGWIGWIRANGANG